MSGVVSVRKQLLSSRGEGETGERGRNDSEEVQSALQSKANHTIDFRKKDWTRKLRNSRAKVKVVFGNSSAS